MRAPGPSSDLVMKLNLKPIRALVMVGAMAVGGLTVAEESLDPTGLPGPAWYTDPETAAVWKRLTGEYIYQRSCTSCHTWGPNRLTRAEWDEYLHGFPGNHEPDVGDTYEDLTAQFQPADSVPSRSQQHEALRAFLLEAAPSAPVPEGDRDAVYEGFPAVGDPAPDFEIVDIEGHRHSLADYRGRKRLIVVFSRAHW